MVFGTGLARLCLGFPQHHYSSVLQPIPSWFLALAWHGFALAFLSITIHLSCNPSRHGFWHWLGTALPWLSSASLFICPATHPVMVFDIGFASLCLGFPLHHYSSVLQPIPSWFLALAWRGFALAFLSITIHLSCNPSHHGFWPWLHAALPWLSSASLFICPTTHPVMVFGTGLVRLCLGFPQHHYSSVPQPIPSWFLAMASCGFALAFLSITIHLSRNPSHHGFWPWLRVASPWLSSASLFICPATHPIMVFGHGFVWLHLGFPQHHYSSVPQPIPSWFLALALHRFALAFLRIPIHPPLNPSLPRFSTYVAPPLPLLCLDLP